MSENNYIFFCKKVRQELLKNNPSLREKTQETYVNILWRLVKGLEEDGYQTAWIGSIPFVLLKDYEAVVEYIKNLNKGISTTKNYISVCISLVRGVALDNPGICEEACKYYRKAQDELLQKISEKLMEQKPSEKEECLKDLSMKTLKKGLNYHKQLLKKNPYDIETAVLLFVGTLATEFCLRNEPATMMLSNKYLDKIEYPKTNFLWNRGRNKKIMVIRENKVRVGGKDPEKTLEVTGELNRTINQYLRAYLYCDPGVIEGLEHGEPMPLLWKSKGDLNENISGSGYCAMLKRVWSHKNINMTSTLIRKIFSIDVRKEHNGKMEAELKACEKLDHGLHVHNSNYILFFE
jgi:hypothetical protein